MFHNEQKQDFVARLLAGEQLCCSCCGRWAQVYKRRIHGAVARQLIMLYRMGGGRQRRFVNSSDIVPIGQNGSGDLTKAAYWGLIEKYVPAPDGQKSSGLWGLTEFGCDFVEGNVKIKEIANVFDDKVLGFAGKEMSIKECLGAKFDYYQLLNGV